MIDESLAIELTKNCLINGQDEKPKSIKEWNYWNGGNVRIRLSDDRVKWFNRAEVEHAKLMLANRKEER